MSFSPEGPEYDLPSEQLQAQLREIDAARADKRRTHALIKQYIDQARDNLLDIEKDIENLDRQEAETRQKLSGRPN